MRHLDLAQAIDLSLKPKPGSYPAKFSIFVDGDTWDIHEVSIAYRGILCSSDKGYATLIVDTYGSRSVAELFDWERVSE